MRKVDWSNAPEGADLYANHKFWRSTNEGFGYAAGGKWIRTTITYDALRSFWDFEQRTQPWPEEDRIDIIGTNGNTGESYNMVKSATDYLSQGMKILTERGNQYGSNGDERSFPQVAQAFNAITGQSLSGSHVCLILNLVKKVRQYAQPNRLHEDSLVDAVNYDALWCQELAKELSE